MRTHKLIGLLAGLALSSSLLAAPLVYIPLGSGNSIIEVDGETDQIINSYEGVINAHGLAATPDGEYLIAGSLEEDYQLKAKGEPLNSKLYLIHRIHGHVIQTIPVEGWSHHQAVTPDGRYVLSSHPTRNHISVVDLESGKQALTIKTGNGPYFVLISSDGKRAYVSNSGSGTVDEIDTQSWTVARTLEAGSTPEHMVLSEDEKTLYVNNTRKGVLSAIDLTNQQVRNEFMIGGTLHGLDISDDGTQLFITRKKDEKLVALNPLSGEKKELSLSPVPYHLNTIKGTGKVYISSRSTPLIWVVDQQTLQITNTIDLPTGEGHQMAIIND